MAGPGWGDVRAAVVIAAEAVAEAVRRGGDAHVREAVAVLRDLAGQLRPLAFDEEILELERARAAADALAAAGVAPAPRPRLRAVP